VAVVAVAWVVAECEVIKMCLRAVNFLFVCALMVASQNSVLAKKIAHKPLSIDQIPQAIANTDLTREKIPSPHWEKNSCSVCHKSQRATNKNLRKKNISEICLSCHDAEYDHRYIHPINIKPSANMLKRMEKSYRESLQQSAGTISCTTCHDIQLQCEPEKSRQKLTNSSFFRSGPFETRSQACYFCHDKKYYKKLNPHDQMDSKGNIVEKKCRICHAGSIDELNQAESIKEVEFHAPADNLASMCLGCHVWTPHPGGQFSFFKNKSGPNHLVKPSSYVLKLLQASQEKNKILFPLEPQTGKVFCGTCHNTHQKGAIKNTAAAKGADSKRRLRDQDICQYCHNK